MKSSIRSTDSSLMHRAPARRPRGTASSSSPTPTAARRSSSRTGPASRAGADVTAEQWRDAQWQRAHCVKNIRQLRELSWATCSRTGSTPTSSATRPSGPRCRCWCRRRCSTRWCRPRTTAATPSAAAFTEAFYADPVRRYMLPVFSDRRTDWPSHPYADPRLAARARHVGRRGADPPLPDQGARRAAPDLPAVLRALHPDGPGRQLAPQVVRSSSSTSSRSTGYDADARLPARARRASATSWSPAATWRTCRGRTSRPSSTRLLEIENIRDIRLATKALMGLPQHWLQDDVRAGMEPAGHDGPRARGVALAIHTHVNAAQSVTPLVARGRRRRCWTPGCATSATRAC